MRGRHLTAFLVLLALFSACAKTTDSNEPSPSLLSGPVTEDDVRSLFALIDQAKQKRDGQMLLSAFDPEAPIEYTLSGTTHKYKPPVYLKEIAASWQRTEIYTYTPGELRITFDSPTARVTRNDEISFTFMGRTTRTIYDDTYLVGMVKDKAKVLAMTSHATVMRINPPPRKRR